MHIPELNFISSLFSNTLSNMDFISKLPFTKEQLNEAGLIGKGASEYVLDILKTISEQPELLDLTLFTLECTRYSGRVPPSWAFSPTISKAVAYTAVGPYLVSDYERLTYYNGISIDPPDLLYRSDLLDNPFPLPKGRFTPTPTKTVHGVFNTPLNEVWHDVAPQICKLLKARHIRYSAVMAARFFIHGEDGEGSLGPIVIWIATHPNTTTAKNAHDASPEIISLLEEFGVKGAVIEWYEGSVETLAGPPLLHVTPDTDPTSQVRRFLTAALGMPISTKEREDDDAQGTVGFFFHENKTKTGEPSDRVLGVSNCHVLRKKTTVDYQFKGAGAPRQLVRVNGMRHFQQSVNEIKEVIGNLGSEARFLARDIMELELQLASNDPDKAQEAMVGVTVKRAESTQVKQHIGQLEEFYKQVNTHLSDIERRNIGHVDWAPKISVDVEGDGYTMDVGTFELDEAKFRPNFKGNVIDLGAMYIPWQLEYKFDHTDTRWLFKVPSDRQLRVKGIASREFLAKPDCFDSSDLPCLVVLKDGNTSDLTVGRYAGLEAYLADDLGKESIQLAIYNYTKQAGDFSAKGDSGSLIVDGSGNMFGLLHSNMPRDGSTHVTFATPAWWIVQKIKEQYPHADLYRTGW